MNQNKKIRTSSFKFNFNYTTFLLFISLLLQSASLPNPRTYSYFYVICLSFINWDLTSFSVVFMPFLTRTTNFIDCRSSHKWSDLAQSTLVHPWKMFLYFLKNSNFPLYKNFRILSGKSNLSLKKNCLYFKEKTNYPLKKKIIILSQKNQPPSPFGKTDNHAWQISCT